MKIFRPTLQKYFAQELPGAQTLADALTFHAFEIESITNSPAGEAVLDVKVTANRGHDCLSHRGIAKELSAILGLPLKPYPYGIKDVVLAPRTEAVQVSIEEPDLCSRYIVGYVTNVKVGPSPKWLSEELGAIGQRSINNVVDATNYVMFTVGQPLHAFDAGMLSQKDAAYSIAVRKARAEETMVALDGKEYALADPMLVITDRHDDVPIGIAGVKGGAPAAISEETTDIIIESANFDGVSVRKTARALKLRTDASSRFEQVISPELAALGMRAVVELISELAGGEVAGFVDEYPRKAAQRTVSVTLEKINAVLGSSFSDADALDVFARLDLPVARTHLRFDIAVPRERLDLAIAEDLIEEVGRIMGYDKLPAVELPKFAAAPEINRQFAAAEQKREELVAAGYSEVFTSVFAEKGDREVLNKVGGERPYLRNTLVDELRDALERNIRNKDLLGLREVKLFEIGIVWRGGSEVLMLGTASEKGGVREAPLPLTINASEKIRVTEDVRLDRYTPFSKYPFIVRDIALWVPVDSIASDVLAVIRSHAGELLARADKFDEFTPPTGGGRKSYAFRLVFQSFDKTLTDGEVNERMESIYGAVNANGWEVR